MADMNVYHLFMNASLLVKVVMLILILFSIISWSIIIQRFQILGKAKNEALRFEDVFWSGKDLSMLYNEVNDRREKISGMEYVFYTGFKEFKRLYSQKNQMPDGVVDGVQRAMNVSHNREIERVENQISTLGMIGSISPYIGLFGTVWGIMNAFIALGSVEQATLKMVAPGISEALIATALGLFAAIPAVMSHNRLNLRVRKLEQYYDNFTEEFLAILYRQIHVTKHSQVQTPQTAGSVNTVHGSIENDASGS